MVNFPVFICVYDVPNIRISNNQGEDLFGCKFKNWRMLLHTFFYDI